MQSNKQITDTSKQTVKQALLDAQDNVNSLRSSNSGTAFPSDPAIGMHCYRTDTGKMYMYDGSSWIEEIDTKSVQTIVGDKTFSGKVDVSSITVTGSTSVPTANADNNSKTVANTAFVKTAIANLVNGAPSQLDTLKELSAALGNDANFSATVAKQIGDKVSKSGDTIRGPILYEKTPHHRSELINKDYVDSAIKSAVASVTKTLSANMHAQYPVGCYLYSDKANNPATYLPYMSDTTWIQTAAGRVLIGAGKADSGTTFTAGTTGGEEKHKLTVEEMPMHTHNYKLFIGTPGTTKSDAQQGKFLSAQQNALAENSFYCGPGTGSVEYHLYSSGKGASHMNMQPYQTVYIFHRQK